MSDNPSEARTPRLAVIGLGYVGLPLAVAFAARYPVTAYDVKSARIEALKQGRDDTLEVTEEELAAAVHLTLTDREADLAGAEIFIVTVPTPIDGERRPDLSALESASAAVGRTMQPGALVIFESTVFPGATEEVCLPILEAESGLALNRDFTLGYSPERINPGDRTHRLADIAKVVAGSTPEVTERMAALYGEVVTAGVFQAASIQVAEAAKVIENTQRDINIALMNELALICERLDIATRDVLAAARTKWNFLDFTPGLVGGHCIGVDPYYLTAKAEALGHHPEVILAGRRINDSMAAFVAGKAVKLLLASGRPAPGEARAGVLGLTFKKNVPDLRNSKVVEVVEELAAFGLTPLIHDPLAAEGEVEALFGRPCDDLEAFAGLDLLILAVDHQAYLEGTTKLLTCLKAGGVVMDLRAALDPSDLPSGITYWSL
ncbi:MAG: nucleotide sugar dehydrogenase [Limibacillus sp.]